MSTGAKLLFLVICLLARVTFGGQAIASFVKQSLGLDLVSIAFGMPAQTNGGYETASSPLAAHFVDVATTSWMTNAISGKYNHDFANRVLRFGFRDGRLVAIRISINSFTSGAAREMIDQRRKELVKIQDELRMAGPSHKLNFDDASYRIQYEAMCAPIPESLFLMEIQITPVEKKRTS